MTLDEDLTKEIQQIWPHCDGIRKNGNLYEVALDTTYGKQWFPSYKAPVHVEKYLHALSILQP